MRLVGWLRLASRILHMPFYRSMTQVFVWYILALLQSGTVVAIQRIKLLQIMLWTMISAGRSRLASFCQLLHLYLARNGRADSWFASAHRYVTCLSEILPTCRTPLCYYTEWHGTGHSRLWEGIIGGVTYFDIFKTTMMIIVKSFLGENTTSREFSICGILLVRLTGT